MLPPRSLASALALIASLGAASLLAIPASAAPRLAARQSASPISVDVSRLRALGLGPTAEIIGAEVAEALRSGYGARQGGGRLVVRLTGLSLNAYAGASDGGGGGSSGRSGGGNDNDFLEGEVLVVGPRGEVLSQRPLVTSLNAASGGAYYLPGAEKRRVIAIAQNFAAWALRATL